jgi:fructose-1,6-bisphosphatase/inositol monophosphatase family enzyme
MTRTRIGGIAVPDAPDDIEAAVEVEGEPEDVVEEAAEAARAAIVDVLEARDPKGSTGEDGEEDADDGGSDE